MNDKEKFLNIAELYTALADGYCYPWENEE